MERELCTKRSERFELSAVAVVAAALGTAADGVLAVSGFASVVVSVVSVVVSVVSVVVSVVSVVASESPPPPPPALVASPTAVSASDLAAFAVVVSVAFSVAEVAEDLKRMSNSKHVHGNLLS
jgi:hypothetical protein